VGERIDDDKAVQAVKALYATGFYADVRLEPTATCSCVRAGAPGHRRDRDRGRQEFTKDNLKDGLKQGRHRGIEDLRQSLLDRRRRS